MSEPDGTQASSYPSPGSAAVKTAHRQKVSPKPTQLPPIRLPGVRTFGQGQLAQTERDKALTLAALFPEGVESGEYRVVRRRYGSKSELQGQREEQLDLRERLFKNRDRP